MSWWQIHYATDAQHADALSDHLNELGAVSVTYADDADQPLFEPPPGATPLWRAVKVTGLFEVQTDIDAVAAAVAARSGHLPVAEGGITRLEDQDWTRAWLQYFKPMQFGARLWVVPTAYEPPDPAAVNIRLDPGLAFGTGTHATTALCLQWLGGHPLVGLDVIDFGCGSGILAVGAALLGARQVWAVDIDPQALVATRDNAQLNGVSTSIHTGLAKALNAPPVDIVVANILALPLCELAADLAMRVKPGGWIVLSGLLKDQFEQVSAAYKPWFGSIERLDREDWVRIVALRHGA
ncbi:MAG: 50S ribosomal protein L11 methyltransferase [Gammaproteobacteria bacterium]|nr:50S ribosomal protein L11 methyltransferase [Gammaproteobacteria bacterium]